MAPKIDGRRPSRRKTIYSTPMDLLFRESSLSLGIRWRAKLHASSLERISQSDSGPSWCCTGFVCTMLSTLFEDCLKCLSGWTPDSAKPLSYYLGSFEAWPECSLTMQSCASKNETKPSRTHPWTVKTEIYSSPQRTSVAYASIAEYNRIVCLVSYLLAPLATSYPSWINASAVKTVNIANRADRSSVPFRTYILQDFDTELETLWGQYPPWMIGCLGVIGYERLVKDLSGGLSPVWLNRAGLRAPA